MQNRKNTSKARIAHNYIRDVLGLDEEHGFSIDDGGAVFPFVAETGNRRREMDGS